MITHPLVTAHNPTILLVSPPPVNEYHLELEDINKKGYKAVTRHQSFTAQYADAIREISKEFKDQKIVLVDLWVALMQEGLRRSPGQPKEGALLGSKEDGDSMGLRALLVDGIHLTGLAYELFLKTLLPLLEPNLTEDALPWIFP
jgi:lysophospholipase L1-like esterase